MGKKLPILASLALLAATGAANAGVITYMNTAGDVDFGANRDAYDVSTNMDFFVFPVGSGESGAATNSLGAVDWEYVLPNQVVTALSGTMSVRVWDIDPGDDMEVYFNLPGGTRVLAGELTGSNGGNVTTWENAVAAGTTANLSGWSTTTFNLSAATLAALSGTSSFTLDLDVRNEATESWAAVIDYATLTLRYDAGAPNPNIVPLPPSAALAGLGLLGLAGLSRLRRRKLDA